MIKTLKLRISFLLVLGLQACATSLPAVAPCTNYCTTQPEGYQWAQSANLTDARGCEGNYPEAFKRGCRDAVNDFQQALAPGRDGL